ncbi:MAG: hypothetical protein ACYS80_09115, partial [Planctomycetota bacterium]
CGSQHQGGDGRHGHRDTRKAAAPLEPTHVPALDQQGSAHLRVAGPHSGRAAFQQASCLDDRCAAHGA